jgi:mercuric ion transport protein
LLRVHRAKTTAIGGLLAAFFASVCCLGPWFLAALGVSIGATGGLAGTAGMLRVLLLYRPLFIVLAVVFLSLSFYGVYREPTGADSCQACGGSGPRLNRLTLWIIAGTAVALLLAPYWFEL